MKLQKKNADGKIVTKEVPDNLIDTYIQIGWEKVTKKTFLSPKIEKKNSANPKFSDNIKDNG